MRRGRFNRPGGPRDGLSAPPSPEAALERLFTQFFGPEELRRFLRDHWPELDDLVDWRRAPREVSDQVVRLLDREGLIGEELFRALLDRFAERPKLQRIIRRAAHLWLGPEAAAPLGDDDLEDDANEDDPPPVEQAPAAPEAPAPPPERPPKAAGPPWWRFSDDAAMPQLEIFLDPGAAHPDGQPLPVGAELPCLFRCAALNVESGGSFVMPWGPGELRELRESLRGRRGAPPGAVGLRRWGLALRGALRGFEEVAGAVAQLPGLRVSIRSQRSALLNLPWELLPLQAGPGAQPLALEAGCSVVRRLRTLAPPRRQLVQSEGGVLLFAWSAAGGAVPAEAQGETLRALCAPRGVPVVELGGADLPTLFTKARELAQAGTPVRVMHLLCHGARVSADPEVWGLSLGTPQNPSRAEPSQLRTLLANALGTLELLTLFACAAGDAGDDANPLGSVAEAAFFAGVDVIAPSLPLSVRGANLAVQAIYAALLSGASLDAATRDAVAQLQLAGTGDQDWVALSRLEPGGP